jgi:predicted ATPase/transcriptional regulator with XRE-family HTH domain/Tfp pilus assembly protein PilF
MKASHEIGQRASLLAFGHLLKRLRLAADLTQEELAERAAVSVRSISNLERGAKHRPHRETVALLAEALRLRGADRDGFIALARGRSMAEALTERGARDAPSELPRPPTPIVGREEETAAVTALLFDRDVRLVSLTGPGGVGKTRLALEVSAGVAETLRDGATFVDLAPLRDPELALAAIAHAVGVAPSPDQPLRRAVVNALDGKQMLLVLDNFEHLIAAGAVVADLLTACPGLTVLATSRVPLHLRAEHEFMLEPLPLPNQGAAASLEQLGRVPAVDLFVRRAMAANRGFTLSAENARDVAEIAARLDGLPLAIELAATRSKVLAPAALLARLERRLPLLAGGAHDLPPRQRALRATLDWSHDLLSADEQRLFRRLAVFAGGCTLEAAALMADVHTHTTDGVAPEAMDIQRPAADTRASPDALELLTGLVDKSLVRAATDALGEQRFGMLETIREYGLERLAAAGDEAAAFGVHRAWCVELAESADAELIGAEQQRWFRRLEDEIDNLRAALGNAIAEGEAEAAMRLAGALYRFWANRGHFEEGRRWLEQALALDTSIQSTARGNALLGLGVMVFFQGDYDWAAALWSESLALFTALGDTRGIAYSHGNLGLIADAREEYERAIEEYTTALHLFRQLDDQRYVSFMLHNLGLIAYFQERSAQATALFEESLAIARALRDQNSIAMTLGNLGLVAFQQGDLPRALALQREALTDWQLVTNKPWLARTVENIAQIAAATEHPERAALLFGASDAFRSAFGSSLPPNDRQIIERWTVVARAQMDEAAFADAWARGAAMSLDEAVACALGYDHPSGALSHR